MPYYIEVCLLRSHYFVTLAALRAILIYAEWLVFSYLDTCTYYMWFRYHMHADHHMPHATRALSIVPGPKRNMISPEESLLCSKNLNSGGRVLGKTGKTTCV